MIFIKMTKFLSAGLSYSDSDVVVDAGNDYESYATRSKSKFSHPGLIFFW